MFKSTPSRTMAWGLWMLTVVSWIHPAGIHPLQAQTNQHTHVIVLEIEGVVEYATAREPERWRPCTTNQVLRADDQLRTGKRSRTLVRLQDFSEVPLGPESQLRVMPREQPGAIFEFFRGVLYWFRRDDPRDHRIQTPTVSCASRNTEYHLEVLPDGTTLVTLFDGTVTLTNRQGQLILQSRQAARVTPGQEPVRTPFLDATETLQWRLYYPGVLDRSELDWRPGTNPLLSPSFTAYDSGHLQEALRLYPADRLPAEPAESIYLAALLLVVGEVAEAQSLIDPLIQDLPNAEGAASARNNNQRLAYALDQLIQTVQRLPRDPSSRPMAESPLSSEWMTESYARQSGGDLAGALAAAVEATRQSPEFGFAWSRRAELEFSYGRTGEALQAMNRSLALAPDHAQGWALKGFILSSRNEPAQAMAAFNRALELDGALANAWLGRGLCLIRQGRTVDGLRDLQSASALEPQRSLLRSYLGKAFHELGREDLAAREWERAAAIDASDPTPWLYSALQLQQQNRINQSIRHLEKSRALNDQRMLYRSRLLLDQDRAIRGANLAGLYQDAGMDEVAQREASRSLSDDYANFAAHWFLANSYQRQRDPSQIELRLESAWLSEYLMANLLSPVHATTLSPQVSLNEYGRFFERDRFGLSSTTEYRSNGDWIQATTQHGQYGNSAYALEGLYRTFQGDRSNNDLEDLTLNLRFKHELTYQDSIFLQATYYDLESGDVARYYDPSDAARELRIEEKQEPLVLLGYHREWTPGSHTLLLSGWWRDDLSVDNADFSFLAFGRDATGTFLDLFQPTSAPLDYESQFEALTLEGQQIWQSHRNTLVAGARFQLGSFDTDSDMGAGVAQSMVGPLASDPISQDHRPDLHRYSAYVYNTFQVVDPLQIQAGVVYDYLEHPENHRFSPIQSGETHSDQISPKAGFILTPTKETTLRGSYTRSLGGVSFDQSFRLEPTQVGGLNQAYRSLIPESAVGSLTAPEFETVGLALDHRFPQGTYVGIQGDWLRSDVDQRIGVVDFISLPGVPNFPSSTRDRLEYDEKVLLLTLDQLWGDHWAVGGRYRLSEVDLDQSLSGVQGMLDSEVEATLHQVAFLAQYHHDSGLFAQGNAIWTQQSNRGYAPDIPGDDFWQFHVHIGYRLFQRNLEWRLSLLNLFDQDYRLNPLNLTPDLPRERTLATSLRWSL